MTVKRKEEKKAVTSFDIDSIIAKGGKTVSESIDENKELKFTLRIPANTICQIDACCKNRVGNVSRNTWILEAIQKCLDLEEKD